jgi:hypothetical protein
MGVDLGNLSISLDRFNEVASGKFNIGQLKLSEDGTSVYRTNNHKTWTIFNNTKISSAESLAIKTAFCRALANEGLSTDDINDIKEKLGIAGPEVDLFRPGGMKPLSAVEVREIIDEYAGKINENRAAKADGVALKTSAEIYRGVSDETLQSRAETRDSINESTLRKGIETDSGKLFNAVMDITRSLEPGRGEKPTGDMINVAKEIRSAMRRTRDILTSAGSSITLKELPISLVRGDDDKISIKLMLDDGNSISLRTNLDKYELHTAMGNIEAVGYAGKDDKPVDDASGVKKVDVNKLQNDMVTRFNICSDEGTFDKMVKIKMAKDKDYAKIMESAKNTEGVTEKQTKEKLDKLETKIRSNLRSSMTDDVIEPLQQALKDANVRKEDRTAILSKCRNILSGDPTSAKEKTAILNVVRCIVTNKRILDIDLKNAGLEGFHDPSVKIKQEDDIDTTFSINDYLNGI